MVKELSAASSGQIIILEGEVKQLKDAPDSKASKHSNELLHLQEAKTVAENRHDRAILEQSTAEIEQNRLEDQLRTAKGVVENALKAQEKAEMDLELANGALTTTREALDASDKNLGATQTELSSSIDRVIAL